LKEVEYWEKKYSDPSRLPGISDFAKSALNLMIKNRVKSVLELGCGIAEEAAFSASLLLFGMNILIPSLLGLSLLLKQKTVDLLSATFQQRREAA